MINDVSAMTGDAAMGRIAAELGSYVVLMHSPGPPTRIVPDPVYGDVVADVRAYLAERVAAADQFGIDAAKIVIDPGIGFGKSLPENLALLRRLRELKVNDLPLLIGTSRKSMIGRILDGAPPDDRIEGTAATVAVAISNGASIVRVHDVKQMSRVVRVADAIVRGN